MNRQVLLCVCLWGLSSSGWAQESSPNDPAANGFPKPNSTQANPQPSPGKVGQFGRMEAIQFTGLKTFSDSELRKILSRDFDVVLAGNAHADLNAYLKVLEQRLSDGFLKSGFPHAKITATANPNAGQIQITIEEGQQYRNHGVKVVESPELDCDLMAKFLQDPKAGLSPDQIKRERMQLQTSDPSKHQIDFGSSKDKTPEVTNFFEDPGKKYEEAIKAGFADQGFFFPQYTVELKPGENGKAFLWIQVKHAGPKAKIGQLTIDGLKHHQPEDIQEFLGIKQGLPVNHLSKAAWERKLNDSLCFLESRIVVLPRLLRMPLRNY